MMVKWVHSAVGDQTVSVIEACLVGKDVQGPVVTAAVREAVDAVDSDALVAYLGGMAALLLQLYVDAAVEVGVKPIDVIRLLAKQMDDDTPLD